VGFLVYKIRFFHFEFALNVRGLIFQYSVYLNSRQILKKLLKKIIKSKKRENIDRIISVTALQAGLFFFC
jgi:hypothetical protein